MGVASSVALIEATHVRGSREKPVSADHAPSVEPWEVGYVGLGPGGGGGGGALMGRGRLRDHQSLSRY